MNRDEFVNDFVKLYTKYRKAAELSWKPERRLAWDVWSVIKHRPDVIRIVEAAMIDECERVEAALIQGKAILRGMSAEDHAVRER